jgi:hypothetical protein
MQLSIKAKLLMAFNQYSTILLLTHIFGLRRVNRSVCLATEHQ